MLTPVGSRSRAHASGTLAHGFAFSQSEIPNIRNRTFTHSPRLTNRPLLIDDAFAVPDDDAAAVSDRFHPVLDPRPFWRGFSSSATKPKNEKHARLPRNEDFNAGERGLQMMFEYVPDGSSEAFELANTRRVGLQYRKSLFRHVCENEDKNRPISVEDG